jgi:hypothetical protein
LTGEGRRAQARRRRERPPTAAPATHRPREAAIRHEIDTALRPLVGLPLAYAGRAVDMATFGFGGVAQLPGAGQGVVAAYRLHVQEIWRIVRDGRIIVGYGDYFYPPAGSAIARAEFVARDAERTRRDDLVDDWIAHGPDAHTVDAAHGSEAGDLAVTFRDGCRLETFACSATVATDGSDEFWRLVPPRLTGTEPTLVVTAHGVEH